MDSGDLLDALVQCTAVCIVCIANQCVYSRSLWNMFWNDGIYRSPHEAFSVEVICWERIAFKYRTWGFSCFHCSKIVLVFISRSEHSLFKNLMILWGTEQAKGNKLKRTGIKYIVISKNVFNQLLLIDIFVSGLEIVDPGGSKKGTVPVFLGLLSTKRGTWNSTNKQNHTHDYIITNKKLWNERKNNIYDERW